MSKNFFHKYVKDTLIFDHSWECGRKIIFNERPVTTLSKIITKIRSASKVLEFITIHENLDKLYLNSPLPTKSNKIFNVSSVQRQLIIDY